MGAARHLEVAAVIEAFAVEPVSHQQLTGAGIQLDPGQVGVARRHGWSAGAEDRQAGEQEEITHGGLQVDAMGLAYADGIQSAAVTD